MATPLGRLKKIELREAWIKESGDFTPWLAKPENLELLGDAVGIDLELEAQEKDVGPFRADILCKNAATGEWVLIENQLERTDHSHLGQLLTYAAGLNAVTIIWIAQRFTDEHRAALDWLNEITGEKFDFIGLEIELWRIGNSDVAPKFNVVSKSNIRRKPASRTDAFGSLSKTERLQTEYWTAFWDYMREQGTSLKGSRALPQSWISFGIGRSEFSLWAQISAQKKYIAVGISCFGPNAKIYFKMLKRDQAIIESEAGFNLEWDEGPNRKDSRIEVWKEADPADHTQWFEQHAWLKEKVETLHKVFARRLKEIEPVGLEQLVVHSTPE